WDSVAYHTVQYASCLLGVPQLLVDFPGMFEPLFDCILRYFVENNSVIIFIFTKRMAQMPGNGFTFAVRVTCQVYFLRFFGFLLQIFEKWTLAANGNVFRLVIDFRIYPRLTARQIS